MKIPTIHLNGTNAETLIDEATDTLNALNAAIRGLEAMTINGRDYYPQGSSALSEAQREHLDRIARVAKVREEIAAYLEAIVDAAN